MIVIDGSQGEGGGQILRSALTLSMVTGKPFRIEQIRAKRAKPGLLRQHLAAIRAAESVCRATATGAEPGSSTLTFDPGAISGGEYRFAIGSAGSTSLVLQTVLPALASSGCSARIVLQGGTHNTNAPPFDFLERAFLPLMRQIGWVVAAEMNRPGFYPAGGGEIVVSVSPCEALRPLVITERGALRRRFAEAVVSNLPFGIAERELRAFGNAVGWSAEELRPRMEKRADGPGNVIVATLEFANLTEVLTSFGERGVSAETVGARMADAVVSYLRTAAPVGPFLADQLLLPVALGRGGRLVTVEPTPHTLTNVAIITSFLDVAIGIEQENEGTWGVTVDA